MSIIEETGRGGLWYVPWRTGSRLCLGVASIPNFRHRVIGAVDLSKPRVYDMQFVSRPIYAMSYALSKRDGFACFEWLDSGWPGSRNQCLFPVHPLLFSTRIGKYPPGGRRGSSGVSR
jgi:hypothetical protein